MVWMAKKDNHRELKKSHTKHKLDVKKWKERNINQKTMNKTKKNLKISSFINYHLVMAIRGKEKKSFQEKYNMYKVWYVNERVVLYNFTSWVYNLVFLHLVLCVYDLLITMHFIIIIWLFAFFSCVCISSAQLPFLQDFGCRVTQNTWSEVHQ